MEDVKINTSKTFTLTLPGDPENNVVSASLYHEFGPLVFGPTNATRVSTGLYTITYGQQPSGIFILNSAGRHKVDFTYTIGGVSYSQSQYINVYTPYVNIDDFFEDRPDLEQDYYEQFDKLEKRVRNIINTFCGQSFDFYPEKYIEISGSGKNVLHLPYPINNLKKITVNVGDEDEAVVHDQSNPTVNNLEKSKEPHNFNSSYYIQFKKSILDTIQSLIISSKFEENDDYKIEGDFGWAYVPDNVSQAAALLLEDVMNGDSSYRRHGMTTVDLDILKYTSKDSFYESTGNIDADVLLMDYTLFVMDYVV